MFEYNSEYLNQGIGTGGTYINQSGVYEMAISEAYLLKMQNTYSEALILELEDLEEKKAKVNIWYKNKNGEKVEFQEKHITHLMYLLSINPKTIKSTLNTEKNSLAFYTAYSSINPGGKIIFDNTVTANIKKGGTAFYYDLSSVSGNFNFSNWYDNNFLHKNIAVITL